MKDVDKSTHCRTTIGGQEKYWWKSLLDTCQHDCLYVEQAGSYIARSHIERTKSRNQAGRGSRYGRQDLPERHRYSSAAGNKAGAWSRRQALLSLPEPQLPCQEDTHGSRHRPLP